MHVSVLIPPDPVVTWAEAQVALRLEDDDEEREYVEALIAAATAWIDGPAGWVGISIGRQTLEARLDSFDGSDIRLPYGPVIAPIDSVKYLDGNGLEQTRPSGNYILLGDGRLVRNPGSGWPSTNGAQEGIRIIYEAGHDEAPAPIKQAILLLVGQWFRTRSAIVKGEAVSAVPFAVRALLQPFESWR